MQDTGIVRNRLKVESIIRNARGYLELRDQGHSFRDFLWSFVGGEPIQNHWQRFADVPVYTPEAEAMSKALKNAASTLWGPPLYMPSCRPRAWSMTTSFSALNTPPAVSSRTMSDYYFLGVTRPE